MRYIRYIGQAHVRQITAADWRTIGINGETVMWSAFNGFAVPADQLTDDQIRKAIDPDQYFVITGDEDEEFVPQPQNRDMTPETLNSVAVDITDDAARTAALEGSQGASTADVDTTDKTPASTSGGAPSTKANR